MEGRSGALVVLATGIDPSPLVLPPLPSSSRPSVIAAPPSLALLPSRVLPHPRSPSLSFSNALADAHTDSRGRLRTHPVYTRECRSFLSLVRDSHVLSLSSPSPTPAGFLLILDLLNLNIQIQRTLAVHRAYLRCTHPYLCLFICAIFASPLACGFSAISLTVAEDDLFIGEHFFYVGEYFSRLFKGFINIFPFESCTLNVIRVALRAHGVGGNRRIK